MDVARIQTGHAHSSCYHLHTDCSRQMNGRLSLYSHAVGQQVCASMGMSNAVRCGFVTDTNRDAWWTINGTSISAALDKDGIIANMLAIPGDSGSGVMNGTSIHGILTESQVVGTTAFAAFIPAYFVKSNMGNNSFDFNCNNYTGSYWPACPIV